MKKVVLFVVWILICCCGIYGCDGVDKFIGEGKLKEPVCVDSKVNYLYTIPCDGAETSIYFEVPFYRVYGGEDLYSESLEMNADYTIGEDAILDGDNVDELNGMIVSVMQYPLSEYTDDEFYNKRLEDCYIDKYMNSEDDGKIRDIIKKKKKKYIENCYVLFLNILFEGNIEKDVNVREIKIPDLGFQFGFDELKIEKTEVPENVMIDNGQMIDFSALSGIFSDGFVSESGYLPVEGKAGIDISEISVFSLNNYCEVINKDNYNKYREKEEVYGTLYEVQKETDYKIDDEIALAYSYLFDRDVVNIDTSDAVVASLVIQATDEKGNKYWKCVYQPSVISGRYLILQLLYNEIG